MHRPHLRPSGQSPKRLLGWRTVLPALAFAAALLGGCVASPPPKPAVHAANGFSSDEASQVFEAGYEAIADRYVDPIAIGDVAFQGLRGISELDGNLDVIRYGPELELLEAGRIMATVHAPNQLDPDGWADTTVKMLGLARSISRPVDAASMERLYAVVFDNALPYLDEFSRYAGAKLAAEHRAARDGFGGIGFEFDTNAEGYLIVTSILPDTPASRGGLKVGDRITYINGTSVGGLSPDKITDLLHGRIDTDVDLDLLRDGVSAPIRLKLERELIVPETVSAHREGDIGYIRITSFNHRTAASVSDAYYKLKAGGPLKGLVLDLRDNPGGLLDQAVGVADLFLTSGEIISTRGRHPDSSQEFDASGQDITGGLPLVVLMNGESASAAEVVAAALQDRDRATLVGSVSYGKGTVQNVIRLPNDGELTITWSRIFSPRGYAFHHFGLMPNVCTNTKGANAESIIADLRSGRINPALILTKWRAAYSDARHTPAQLRATCPPQHEMLRRDVSVAIDLLSDHTLYTKAMGETPYPAVAVR